MSDAAVNPMKAGLEDVVVSPSEICFIDGHKGRLVYRGFDVDDLVAQSNFEEVTYLLWYGKLPTRKELDAHVKALSSTANRKLPPKLIGMLKLLPKKTTPMEVLRTGISALSAFDPDAGDNSREATLRKTIRLTAQMPTLVAAWDRIRRGKPPVAPNPRLSLAGNFVYMVSGKKPTPLATKTFDVALILHADHEFNASTFAARVTAATLSDIHSAVVSGIGALKGPLHGGANEQVMLMVEKIKDPTRAESWIRKALADKARDISEVLVALDPPRPTRRLDRTVTYHDACHLLHGQKVRAQPRELLRRIPGLTVVEIKDSDLCCGSAGIYNLTEPAMAEKLGRMKVERIPETGARIVAAGNPGCLMQIAKHARDMGVELEAVHPVDLLARALRDA